MPIFFIIVGVMLVIVAINDKMTELGSLIKEDFKPASGGYGFSAWIVAVFVIGALGYFKAAKPIANAFLLLVVVSMILSNRGFFSNFSNAFKGNNS